MLEASLKYADGRLTTRDVFDGVMNKVFTLWVARKKRQIQAVCVARVVDSPRKRVLDIFGWSGEDRDEWLPLEETLAAYARAMGCQEFQIWTDGEDLRKILGDDGWQEVATVMRKDI